MVIGRLDSSGRSANQLLTSERWGDLWHDLLLTVTARSRETVNADSDIDRNCILQSSLAIGMVSSQSNFRLVDGDGVGIGLVAKVDKHLANFVFFSCNC